MRKIDMEKKYNGKAAKTINFDVAVLEQLEATARRDGSTVSHIVNLTCRRNVMNEIKFFNEMALYHAQEQAKYEFLTKRVAELTEIKNIK